MPYFTTKQLGLFSSYQLNKKEEENLNKFLMFLENSGVGELIHQESYRDHSKGGRPPYNYYNLFAASIYAFSIFSYSSSVKIWQHTGSKDFSPEHSHALLCSVIYGEALPRFPSVHKAHEGAAVLP